tara:strand:+ start:1322 stop:1537 length:216 start_codon:yes stop_codon:yes gene_type:complete
MATKKYQAKNSCKRVIPFWVESIVGRDNYKELQRGNAVSLSTDLKRGVFEFLVEVPSKPVVKKTPKTKEKK